MKSQDHFDRDPKTGFLVPKHTAGNLVQLQEKLDFLTAFKESANFAKSAKMIGRSGKCIRSQFKIDSAFHAAYRDIIDELCDEREESLFKMGKHNVTAAFGFLKAFRPHIWNDRKIVEQKQHKEEKLKNLLDQMEDDSNGKA